jgi:hypothetical protein
MDKDAEKLLLFTVQRNVSTLFKSFLSTLENVVDDHDEALLKLHSSLPPEYKKYVELADYLSESRCSRIRKLILDSGNDCYRQIEEEFKKYKIDFQK